MSPAKRASTCCSGISAASQMRASRWRPSRSAATMNLALLKGIRSRYPDWKYLIDGDGGDENLKDYPIEENPELTIKSVLNNLMLYQEAQQAGKSLHGLETIREQLDVFDTMPEGDQVALLQDAVDNLDLIDEMNALGTSREDIAKYLEDAEEGGLHEGRLPEALDGGFHRLAQFHAAAEGAGSRTEPC